jgi:hypothetical protein
VWFSNQLQAMLSVVLNTAPCHADVCGGKAVPCISSLVSKNVYVSVKVSEGRTEAEHKDRE